MNGNKKSQATEGRNQLGRRYKLRGLQRLGMCAFLMFAMVLPTGCSLFKFKRRQSASSKRKARKAARAKKTAVALKEFPTWVKSQPCEGAGATYFKKFHNYSNKDIRQQAAVKLAKCGDWKSVFERLFASNRGWALSMLRALESAKLPTPVGKAMAQWIDKSEQPFHFRMGTHIADFLRYAVDRSSQKGQYCKAYYLSAKKANNIRSFRIRSKVRRYGLGFLMVGGCKQYKRFVTAQLSSNWWVDRKIACEVLGKWGIQRTLRKVSILASTDPFIHRGASRRMRRPIYSVRIACRAAAGRIRMSR